MTGQKNVIKKDSQDNKRKAYYLTDEVGVHLNDDAAQHRLHLTAFGAVRGGHLAEKWFVESVVLLESVASQSVRPFLLDV
jgi:hypothetical protein